ncbi:tetratricopeptide repeat protein [Terrisporobacter petrolearius]|uniref:tetratricopeptide repeat protein n=1 Tax=Terrisporobacter petrolearius TaxID=1460447 RepID=UPI0031CC4B50
MGWFSRKKDKNVSEQNVKTEAINIEELKENAAKLKEDLQNSDGNERVNILNKIGDIYYKISDYDEASKYYEESLNLHKAIGKSYTNLLNIYNAKRKEAAVNRDDEQIQYYLVKIDEMMKISKDVVRGNV